MKKVLKFKNYFLYSVADPSDASKILVRSIQDWLMEQKLHGPASRFRIRFVKLVQDRIEELGTERTKLLEEHSKNKKGETVYLLEDGKEVTEKPKQGNYRYNVANLEKYVQGWEDYLNEEYLIDVTASNKETISGLKDILLNTRDEFEGREAVRQDEMCQSFEDVFAK